MLSRFAARFRRQNRITTIEPTKLESKEDNDSHEWDRPLEFIFSLISNSVGLGNVWRFPYLAAKNGGGAFLIPYFTLYFLIGAPIYYLELALGQFSSRGPATSFTLAKGWQGVGFAMIINSVFCMLYYNVIISWALFYFITSFRSTLLWTSCDNWWNDQNCYLSTDSRNSTYAEVNGITLNCSYTQYQNWTEQAENNTLFNCVPFNVTRVTPTEQFYYRLLLGRSNGFEDFGTPQTYGALCLLGAWLIVGLCIIRGVKSSGKVAYFTAIFPYVVLLILIIQSATLPGAVDGIKYYVIPKWDRVGQFETWQAAATQVFFSLGLSFGSLIAYSASNKFQNNFFRQMCIVVSCDCFTGVFAGFAVFATIGFLSQELNVTVENYSGGSGPGLAFITYPEALSHMPASPFFSIMFFLMLLALGLGSQFALTDVPITSLLELFPRLRSKRAVAVIITCVVSFLISLPFTCRGGMYLLELFMAYAADTSMVVVGFFEVYSIAYIYGFNRFMNDVKMMLGKRAAQYYLFATWCIISPILMMIVIITKLISSKPVTIAKGAGYEEYIFPIGITVCGWFIFVICVIPIPIVYIYTYIREYRLLRLEQTTNAIGIANESVYNEKAIYLEAITRTNSPRNDWGPKKTINHFGLYAHLNKIQSNAADEILQQIRARSANNPSFQTTNIDF